MQENIVINILVALMVVWTILWKCYSVWVASKNNDKKWFIALVIFNTAGILDIIYIFGVAKKKRSEVKAAFYRLPKIFEVKK